MATEDARYRETSQYRLWSFSPSKLSEMREATNTAARESISERLLCNPPPPSAAVAISAPTSSANTPDPENGGNSTPNPNALPDFLTPAEELHLVSFYTSELLRAATEVFNNLSDHVKATAAIFFKRFYVTNSIMTYPPTEMMIVALFFGCKAEGLFSKDVREFVQKFGKRSSEEILAGEFLLCQGLRFSLDVKHPFRALRGAIMRLASLEDVDKQRLNAAQDRAREILRFAPIMTDAYFHYTPSQIMMAALSLADRGLAERLIQDTFHFVAPPEPGSGADTPDPDAAAAMRATTKQKPVDKAAIIGSHLRDKVLGAIEACRDILSKELPERRDHWTNKSFIKTQITPLRKKLAKCRDPDRWNLVELQRARREQAIKKGDSEDGDPDDRGLDDAAVFGEALGQPSKKRKVQIKKEEDPFGPAL